MTHAETIRKMTDEQIAEEITDTVIAMIMLKERHKSIPITYDLMYVAILAELKGEQQ